MIYMDASVALAHLFNEVNRPPDSLWSEQIVSSRLLAYEVWTRSNARASRKPPAHAVNDLLSRVDLSEMSAEVLGRLFEPFPTNIRTLDAIHLATADYLRSNGEVIKIATYDRRLAAAADAMGFELVAL